MKALMKFEDRRTLSFSLSTWSRWSSKYSLYSSFVPTFTISTRSSFTMILPLPSWLSPSKVNLHSIISLTISFVDIFLPDEICAENGLRLDCLPYTRGLNEVKRSSFRVDIFLTAPDLPRPPLEGRLLKLPSVWTFQKKWIEDYGRRIFDRKLRSVEESSTVIFDLNLRYFLERSYRRVEWVDSV